MIPIIGGVHVSVEKRAKEPLMPLRLLYSSKLMLLHNSLDCVIGLSSDNVINGRIVYMGLVYYLPRNDYLRSC